MRKTLLAIGAHYDDCVFGIPGILLQAVQKDYRVVVLSLIGDYSNWPAVKGREEELVTVSRELGHHFGVEMRFLDFASGRFELNDATKKATARVVAEVRPDIAFALWHKDRHPDHEAASAISTAALALAEQILGESGVKRPGQVYYYDNGPGHTIGFEPNTFLDISDVWTPAMEWLGQLMAYLQKKTYDPISPSPAEKTKAALARYRGSSCGAQYAEALWTPRIRASQIL